MALAGSKRSLLPAVVTILVLSTGGCTIGGSSTASSPTQVASSSGSKAKTVAKHHTAPKHSALHNYAVAILPWLNRSAPVFDQAASHAAAGSSENSCVSYGTRNGKIITSDSISLLAEEVDGVPHNSAWYKPVAQLHHRMMGVYHYMQGASQACQISFSAGDSNGESSALSDMQAAASQMHGLINDVRGYAHQR